MAPSNKPPVGVKLGKSHTVGALIGKGAFGAVHAVKGTATTTRWATKVVPAPTKTTKKGNSAPEVARNRLYSEYMLYMNQFPDLCGSILPNMPSKAKDGLELYKRELQGKVCTALRTEIPF